MMVFFLLPGNEVSTWKILNRRMQSKLGNTTFYVTSVFSGTVQLEYLIKRLIQKEIEQENNTR